MGRKKKAMIQTAFRFEKARYNELQAIALVLNMSYSDLLREAVQDRIDKFTGLDEVEND
jgi:predicted DNA-binding ribbon-helix-helix protein